MVTFSLIECDGSPISGGIYCGEIWFAVKNKAADTDAQAVFFATTMDGSIIVNNAQLGQCQISITAQQTDLLTPGRCYHAFVKVRLSDGSTWVIYGHVLATDIGIEAP